MKKIHSFKKMWLFTPEQRQLIKENIIGDSINICSGQSDLGDYKLDLEQKADIKADMFHIPLRPFSVDTVIFDPPFSLFWKTQLRYAAWQMGHVARKRMVVVGMWTLLYLKGFDEPKIYVIVTRNRKLTPICIYDRILNSLFTFEGECKS